GSAAADPPAGYYDTVDTSSSELLRDSLHDITDDHQYNSYAYTIINVADEDPLNSANVLVVYENYTYPKQDSGAANYNREHTWPSSYGFPDGGYPYSDYHHLMASKVSYNSDRGSRPFDYCDSCAEKVTVNFNGEGIRQRLDDETFQQWYENLDAGMVEKKR
ncbi:MAG: endonuclease, partial [Thermoanaerobaculales bacterium]|nr:endonuclease [Thermoanaerobaculales bacterium]